MLKITFNIVNHEPNYDGFRYSDDLLQLIKIMLLKNEKQRPDVN
jgi:hypothetical protein